MTGEGEQLAYRHGHHESVLRAHGQRTAADSAPHLLDRLRPGMSLLDVGCGPGSITLDLAGRVGPSGQVVGVDVAPAAVEAARRSAHERGDHTTSFEVADVTALPWPDGRFDVVHAHQVLHHLPDPVAAIAEMARVCQPTGTVALREVDWAVMSWWPRSPELTRWREMVRATLSLGGEPDAGRRLKSWALAAGLRDLECSAGVWCYGGADEVARLSEDWAQRLEHSELAAQAVAAGLTDAEELARVAQGWRRWGQAPDAWLVMVHGQLLGRPAVSAG